MSREHTIQVALDAYEHGIIQALAKASGESVSNTARRRLFGADRLFARAFFAEDLAEATLLSERYHPKLDADPPWPLTLLRLHVGVDSDVFEVFEGKEMLPGKRFPLGSASRFVIAGSPWPYRLLENYSWSNLHMNATVLRLAPCHEEIVYREKVVERALAQ